MLGISTACMPGLSSNLAEFFRTSMEMGFGAFEVGVSSAEASGKDILDLQKRLNLKVVSVHNLFTDKPVDPDNKRGDFLASSDEKKRWKTIEATLDTAKFAKALGASAVILHAGYIAEEGLKESYKNFKERWLSGEEPLNLEVLRKDLTEMRAEYAHEYVERVVRSLKMLCGEDHEILFCLEPRVNFYEIPNLEEMEEIFDRVKEHNLCYWHDTGHCQIQQNLGLNTQEGWLKAFGERMVGIHLHDTVLLEDHFPPGMGDVDFFLIKKYLPEETIKIVEVAGRTTKEELEKSLMFLDKRGLA